MATFDLATLPRTHLVDAVPGSGTFVKGDVFQIRQPSSGATALYVVTTAGTIGSGAVVQAVGGGSGGSGNTATVFKTADTTRNNTSSKTADPHLAIAVPANTSMTVEAYIPYMAATAADISCSWTGPSGATMPSWSGGALASNATTTTSATVRSRLSALANSITLGGLGAGTDTEARLVGALVTTGTAGTLTLTWAQLVADVSDATIYTGAWLRITY